MKFILLLILSIPAVGQDFTAIAKLASAQTDAKLRTHVQDGQYIVSSCNCDITIPTSAWYIDRDKATRSDAYVINPKPGQTVCFADGIRGVIEFHNMNGTADAYITFASCSGTTIKGNPGQHVVQFFNSSFVRVSGQQGPIDITGGGHGLYFRDLSTDVEANSIWFHDLGYSGFEAKTDPTCDPKTWRGAFTLRNPKVINCRFNNLGGEAIYIGESHYNTVGAIQGGPCDSKVTTAPEHDVVGAMVTGCTFNHIGRDAIQIGASTGTLITKNKINDFGYTKERVDANGITWNPGNTGEISYNVIENGSGFAILAQGRGSGKIHHNIATNTGNAMFGGGIMVAAYAPIDASGYIVTDNTFTNINRVGLEYYSPLSWGNNILDVSYGVLKKQGGNAGKITIIGKNVELIGSADQLKLDMNYVPTTASPAWGPTTDIGAIQSVKVQYFKGDAWEVADSLGVLKVWLVSTDGKRIRIK